MEKGLQATFSLYCVKNIQTHLSIRHGNLADAKKTSKRRKKIIFRHSIKAYKT